MTPLQQAVENLIDQGEEYGMWANYPWVSVKLGELRKALEDEQAQTVEPHGWMINGMSEVMSRDHAQAVQTEHQAVGGTAVAYPVYLHPAPPASKHVPEADFGNMPIPNRGIIRTRLCFHLSPELVNDFRVCVE